RRSTPCSRTLRQPLSNARALAATSNGSAAPRRSTSLAERATDQCAGVPAGFFPAAPAFDVGRAGRLSSSGLQPDDSWASCSLRHFIIRKAPSSADLQYFCSSVLHAFFKSSPRLRTSSLTSAIRALQAGETWSAC